MNVLILLLAFATFCSTMIGGLVAIRLRKVIQYFFAFAAGSLIAVAFLDLLPESISTAQLISLPLRYVFIAVVISFLFYSILEKVFTTHHLHEGETDAHGHIMGPIGAGSLVIHSFLDGAAIGAAFQLNIAAGLIVAFAVVSHDFTDGINTITLMFKNRHTVKNASIFLVMDAIAPVLGVVVTSILIISHAVLAIILAIFVGEFIYIGASNLLPETRKHTPWKMIFFMGLGVAVILILTSFI
jgi:zinc transporter ZupT